jgi:hypothetical protein
MVGCSLVNLREADDRPSVLVEDRADIEVSSRSGHKHILVPKIYFVIYVIRDRVLGYFVTMY